MAIRAATAANLGAIKAIVAAAYAKYVPRIGRRPAPMDDDYATALERADVSVFERDGEITGLLVLVVEPGRLLIENVAVDPGHQGEGIGRELLSHAESEARARGLGAVRLYTNAKMVENIALYGRLGYREVERDGRSGFARVFMEKIL
jgi:ribosomal protein S18 acetylase RimI-like enzyme